MSIHLARACGDESRVKLTASKYGISYLDHRVPAGAGDLEVP